MCMYVRIHICLVNEGHLRAGIAYRCSQNALLLLTCHFEMSLSLPIDIDECGESNGQCDHSCQNTVGSYYCYCNESYLLMADGKTCQGVYNIICIDMCVLIVFAVCFILYALYVCLLYLLYV